MAYYDNVNTTLLDLVEPTARRIGEFGCGAGALANAIRARLPNVHYVGIEIMPDQLAMAMDTLDMGLVRNLDTLMDWSQDSDLSDAMPVDSLDHIIFGDVLEHLYDPQRVLREAAKRLRPGGSALVCIPNVQHWSVFAQLIRGSWPQEEAGIFDRTHIRWFTLADMIRLLEQADLVVESVVERSFAIEQGLPLLEDLEPLALSLGVDPNEVIKRGLPMQYVLVGRKPVVSSS